MLWFKTYYEAVGLPKLNGVANQRRFFARLRASFSSGQRISIRLKIRPSSPKNTLGILPSIALADRLRTFCGKKAIPLTSIWAAISSY
jgi:hypothetical protein